MLRSGASARSGVQRPAACPGPCTSRPRHLRVRADGKQQAPDGSKPAQQERELGLGLKAAWFGAELFGNVQAALRGGGEASTSSSGASGSGAPTAAAAAARSVEECLASIRSDYDLDYFISGAADMSAYADDCRFSDDFAAFDGPGSTARFKKNVANLGGLLSDVKIDVNSDWAVVDNQLTTNWRFQGIVKGLPWRPLLAAAGSTTHVIDPQRGVVVEHIERWKADPKEVVARLLRPARTPPGTAWETFMLSLSGGDLAGMWFVLSPRTLPFTVTVGAAALLTRLATGEGFPGGAGGAVEWACALLVPAALITEVVKFAGGMQGGDTGTGGRF